MEFARFETKVEFLEVSNMVKNNEALIVGNKTGVLVDGVTIVPKSTTEWFYTTNGKKIAFDIPFRSGEPNNHLNRNEFCLVIVDTGDDFLPYRFNDFSCNIIPEMTTDYPFLCQIEKN
jgi:hypothetical protein